MLIAIAIFCLVIVEFLHYLNTYFRFKHMKKMEIINSESTKEIVKIHKNTAKAELAAMEDYWSHKTKLLEDHIKELTEALTTIKEK
jgi:hypothetical protein